MNYFLIDIHLHRDCFNVAVFSCDYSSKFIHTFIKNLYFKILINKIRLIMLQCLLKCVLLIDIDIYVRIFHFTSLVHPNPSVAEPKRMARIVAILGGYAAIHNTLMTTTTGVATTQILYLFYQIKQCFKKCRVKACKRNFRRIQCYMKIINICPYNYLFS